ncbi:MAG TPA: hypothetical protein PKN04_16425 [bacterium]|nr:hypothetical protein [bacterium]HNT67373.1 hypothetical protein [bacterium]HOX87038.1 hypothetical protein [bacterium]HPG46369.1 hypothetical protein [bacterium]HPM98717.1 hypothetical protein [bacterium]
MKEWKLYKIYQMGENSCWKLRVAQTAEDALTQCIDLREGSDSHIPLSRCCRAEEVKIPGFRIRVEKIDG